MGSINIGGENAGDAFYRYKMPKMVARIEGRGNGIKTNVVNNVDIAKALERPPEYVIKYFGCELGAQTKFDKKSGTSIVNGAHDTTKLAEVLEGFIKKYVQCYSCGNPETVIKIKKENIGLKCKACGFVSEVDPLLKLNTFIIKNPPENKLSKAEKKVKKAEKDRLKGFVDENGASEGKEEKDKKKKKKKSSSKSKSEEPSGDLDANGDEPEDSVEDDDEEEDDVVWMTDTSEAAMKARAAEQLSSATAQLVTQGNVEAEREAAKKREEAARKAAEAEAARLKAEEEKRLAEAVAKRLLLAGGDENVAAIQDLVAAGKSANAVADALKAADIKGGPAARMRVLWEALFRNVPEDTKIATEVVAKKSYLAPHAKDPAGQLSQLVAVEHLLGVTMSGRVKEVPLVLKALYDADLAEEELIVAWHAKESAGSVLEVPDDAAQSVRAAAQPFVDWLEEAESDEDSSDEE